MRLMSVLIGLAALLAPAAASAQQLPAMQILIETPDNITVGCGISKEMLDTTVRSTMRYNRVAQAERNLGPTIYVSLNSLNIQQGCVTGIIVEIIEFGQTRRDPSLTGHVELAWAGTMLSSARGNHSEKTKAALRELLEQAFTRFEDKLRRSKQ